MGMLTCTGGYSKQVENYRAKNIQQVQFETHYIIAFKLNEISYFYIKKSFGSLHMYVRKKKVRSSRDGAKGQLISKAIYGVLDSPKKTNEKDLT